MCPHTPSHSMFRSSDAPGAAAGRSGTSRSLDTVGPSVSREQSLTAGCPNTHASQNGTRSQRRRANARDGCFTSLWLPIALRYATRQELSAKTRRSEAFALRNLPSDQERFGVGSAAADLERAEILVPVTVGHFRARFYPVAELIEIRDADRAIAHPLGQMLPYPSGQAVPALELRH